MFEVERDLPAERREVERGRAAAPADLARDRAVTVRERARQADAVEQRARVVDVELEVEHGPARRVVFVGAAGQCAARGAPVAGRRELRGRVRQFQLVELPHRRAVFVDVACVDDEPADVVIARDDLVDDQVDRRHRPVGRRRQVHRAADEVVLRALRHDQLREPRVQHARAVVTAARRPRQVARHLVRRDVGLPQVVDVRRADDHVLPVALEQLQRAEVEREALRREAREIDARRGLRFRRPRRVGLQRVGEGEPRVGVQLGDVDGRAHAVLRHVGHPVDAHRAAHRAQRLAARRVEQVGRGHGAERQVGMFEAFAVRLRRRLQREAERHRRAGRFRERRREVQRDAGQVGLRADVGQAARRAAHRDLVRRVADHVFEQRGGRAVQVQAARGVEREPAVDVHRVRAV